MRAAALGGSGAAQYVLALAYGHGRAFRRDPAQSFRWMREAAHSGCEQALLQLAWMYFDGIGTDRDLQAARFWARNASMTWRYIVTGLRHADFQPVWEALSRRGLLARIFLVRCLRRD